MILLTIEKHTLDEVVAVSVARAIYNGEVFVPLTPVKAKKNQEVFVTIIDNPTETNSDRPYLRYAGALSQDDYNEIAGILKDTETVYASEW